MCVCVYLGVYNLTLINSSKWTVSIYLIKKKEISYDQLSSKFTIQRRHGIMIAKWLGLEIRVYFYIPRYNRQVCTLVKWITSQTQDNLWRLWGAIEKDIIFMGNEPRFQWDRNLSNRNVFLQYLYGRFERWKIKGKWRDSW